MAVTVNIPNFGTVQADNAASESTLQQLVQAVNRSSNAQLRNVSTIANDLKTQAAQAKNTSSSMNAMAASAGGAAASTQNLFAQINQSIQSTTGGFSELMPQIAAFGSAMAGTADSISRTWMRMMGDLSVDPIERSAATLNQAIKLATGGVVKLADGVAKIIPGRLGTFASKALGLTANAAGSVAEQLNALVSGELTATIKTFKQFGDMGATFGGGLSDMRTMAYDSGLTLQQFSSVIKAQREEVISFGGTLADGALKVAKVQNEMAANTGTSGKSLQKELLNLGFGLEEQASMSISLMSQMRALGKTTDARNLNEKEVAKATRQYAEDLRILQEATGKDAKAVMEKARKETMNAALMSKLSVDERANLTKVFAGMEELPAEAQGDLKQALMQELTGGTITNPLVASNAELSKYVKETAARMRAGGENITADQLKAGRALAKTVDAQNKAGAGLGAAAAQVALFGGATSEVVSKSSSMATAFSDMASRTDPEGITQSQRAIKEGANSQDKLNQAFTELTVEGKRFNTELGHLNTKILPVYAETVAGLTSGMRGAIQGIQKIAERPGETMKEIGKAVFDSMLAELKNISGYLKPGISSLLDSIINWSKGGATGAPTTRAPGRAAGGPVSSRMPYMVGEIGPELFVPGMSGQIVSNQNLTKQLQAMQQGLASTVATQKQQMASTAQSYQMPDPTSGINEAMQNMLQGPYGFATVMEGVKKQLSEDSNKQFSVLQEQIGKLDELVKEMRNNTSANENIANMLA
jgi:hypothetical protein